MARRTLNYEVEGKIIAQKFDVLRRAATGTPATLALIIRMERLAAQCIEKRLPKKAIQCIHSEMRVWIRDGIFYSAPKKDLLAELAAIDEKRA